VATAVVGLVGGPLQVARSLSPAIHNAAFTALGLDWIYVGLPVEPANLKESIDQMSSAGLRGFNVTMPHKVEAGRLVDRLEGEAREIAAVNTVDNRFGELIGSSTDGQGLLRYLERDLGFTVAGRSVAILGAGGAARATVLALSRAGATSIKVMARRREQAEELSSLAVGSNFEINALGDPDLLLGAPVDLLINATPIGSRGDEPPIAGGLIGPGTTVVDLVYSPPVTPLMRMAEGAGARVHGGLGMLLHQAALSFRTWTGIEPPMEVMSAAALAAMRGPQKPFLKRPSNPAD